MYRKILVALENSDADEFILQHVRGLAGCCHSSLLFVHVADGFAARNLRQLDLRESEEMQRDRDYIEHVAAQFENEGFSAEAVLGHGDPSREICEVAEREQCDLIAMATHGHGFLADVVKGSVANEVRHRSLVPVLLVRMAPRTGGPRAKPRVAEQA